MRLAVGWAVPRLRQTFVPQGVPGRTVPGVTPKGRCLSMFSGRHLTP
jgi:hypothetical protein